MTRYTQKFSGKVNSLMKVLIPGGTGAMGTHLVNILAGMNISVDVTTRQDISSTNHNVKYIRGNAHDEAFIHDVMNGVKYDAVVDFMFYNTEEFRRRTDFLTSHTGQYIHLSSCRVYANSDRPITESSPRLLDVTTDKEYLLSDECALTKARQEDILFGGHARNFTIIRPYITYSNENLKLGVYEKERWLYRALHGRPIVFSRDIASKFTTMTYGYDVALAIAGLVGNDKAFGEIFHVTGEDFMKWEDIAKLYCEVLTSLTGRAASIKFVEHAPYDNTAPVKYDRYYDRIFDNSKIRSIVKNFEPMTIREGLTKCLTEFVRDEHKFLSIDWFDEIRFDRISGVHTPINELPKSWKLRTKYMLGRNFPLLLRIIMLPKRVLRKIIKR